ncbi:hypothetical protein AB0O34_35545 [Sphaerisporangium sp. NPDC088356]|uniref:hypothetical protein n=1 Tax=Sphaerisporangium sp. NPDC088356 TaxID=3154871 RepID=UPI0034209DA1
MPAWIQSDPNADDGHCADAGLRECARDRRCSDPRIVTTGRTTTRRPALTPRAFCDTDAHVIRRGLEELPAQWREIAASLGVKRQATGPKVTVSKSAALPLSLGADEWLREVVYVLTSWEERVAHAAQLATRDTKETRRRPGRVVVPTAARMLAGHVNVLLALPAEPMMRAVSLKAAAALPPGTRGLVHEGAGYADVILDLSGADAGLDVLQLHHRGRRLLGETPPAVRRLHGVSCACGFAELRELLDEHGAFDGGARFLFKASARR